jgi:hypothetical protein
MLDVKPLHYDRSAFASAWLAAVSGLMYSVSFVIIARIAPSLGGGLSGFFLLVGGILSASALVGLYERLRAAGGGYATWALMFGLAAALAATLHGGYDLANVINPPSQSSSLPSPVDPRGLGTFGLAGVALLGFAFLILRDPSFPPGLGYLGYLSGALLVVIYLGRLIILNASSPVILGPAGLEGFLVNPAWYVWLGLVLRRPSRPS